MQNTKYIFFSGKGGVGKTTMACATAVHSANNGKKTLIVTTDPASNLADVFETGIGHKITPLLNNLWGMEIDPDKATEEYRERILAPMRAVMPESVMVVLEEQFNSPCTTEIASFDRFVDFMVAEKEGKGKKYNVVIFDTAPTGHTLRLLELPFDYSDQVSMMVTTNQKSQEAKSVTQKRFDRVIARMKDPEQSIFSFVVYPESTPVIEAYRAMLDLKEAGIQTQFVVANQVLEPEYCTNEFFIKRRKMQEKYLKEIRPKFQLPVTVMPLLDSEIKGKNMIKKSMALLFNHSEIKSL
ncbi:MAG: ArsA family ATPase [Ignavibacteriaceae bacterium]